MKLRTSIAGILSRSFVAVFAAISVMSVRAEVATTTWIGGTEASVLAAANWDNGLPNWNDLVACFTNDVTFTDANSEYWRPSAVKLADGVTVTTGMRDMPAPDHTPNGQWVFDIGEGSTYFNKYVFYGKSDVTFVKKGPGTFRTYWCGNGVNRFRNIDVQGGTLHLSYSSSQRLIPMSNLYVRAGATVKLDYSSNIASNGPLVTLDAGGVINCGDKVQTCPGLVGAGTITNAAGGIRLSLEHSGCVFSGKIFGKLSVNPDVNFAKPGSYCVIGAADTLANATLEIVDVEGFENTVRFAAGIGTFYAKDWPDRVFYDMDGIPVMLRKPGKSWYVDASRTEEQGDGDGTTPETAFRTLKAAMENASLAANDVVYALPGVYSNGVMGTGITRNRVSVPEKVWLVSTEGAEKTFIVGANATNETSYGCGEGAVRCVLLAANSRVQGFTITGGRVDTSSTSTPSKGGGVCCSALSSYVVDCVLSNNVAYRGGAGHYGTWIRCRAYGNRCTQIGSVWNEYCNLYNCVTDGNLGSYSYYVAGNPAVIANCVFGPNDSTGCIRATGEPDKKAHFYNSVFMTPPQTSNSTTLDGEGSVFHRCILAKGTDSKYAYEDCIITNLSAAADRLAFAGLGADLRPLSAFSAVVDAGNNDYWDPPTKLETLFTDLDGNSRVQGRAIDLGAYEYDWHDGAATILASDGGLEISGASLGANAVAAGETLTFTITRKFDSKLLCTGFTTNGVFVAFDDFPNGWTWTVRGDDFNTAVAIKAVYERAAEWFVDPVNGDDANRGYHSACPKRTLAEVMTNTAVASGDVVWAAPGWYTNGVIEAKESSLMQCNRVIVPAGVTLKSTDGAESTFIVGEPSTNAVENARGCGPGAVRCVYLKSGAVLSGFTLTNAYVNCSSSQSGVTGGGVCGGTAEDCIFRNCTAVRGGGAHGSICRRCVFIDNSAAYIGSAANACGELSNCLFDGNSLGSYTVLNCFFARNCTFLPNNAQVSHYSNGVGYAPTNMYNCVILCPGASLSAYTRCLFSSSLSRGSVSVDFIGEGSMKMALADMGLDENGRPMSRTSAAVDAGSNEAYAFLANAGDKDFDGNQRVYNGTIDLGCYEFDWRGDFAKALGSASLSVTEAAPAVALNAGGGLLLPGDGATLAAEWRDAGTRVKEYRFTAQATGEGTLSIFRDGAEEAWETIAAEDGATTLSFKSGAATNSLSFAFSGEGSAVLSGFSKIGGTAIIVR